jgi:hypothetical protein
VAAGSWKSFVLPDFVVSFSHPLQKAICFKYQQSRPHVNFHAVLICDCTVDNLQALFFIFKLVLTATIVSYDSTSASLIFVVSY